MKAEFVDPSVEEKVLHYNQIPIGRIARSTVGPNAVIRLAPDIYLTVTALGAVSVAVMPNTYVQKHLDSVYKLLPQDTQIMFTF
jgi:hypothetical protein